MSVLYTKASERVDHGYAGITFVGVTLLVLIVYCLITEVMDGDNRSRSGEFTITSDSSIKEIGLVFQDRGLGSPDPSQVFNFSSDSSALIAQQSQSPSVMLGQLGDVHAYTPTCDDTDNDQSNNCGPTDSVDAGTRLLS